MVEAQRIAVFLQGGSARHKIKGIGAHGKGMTVSSVYEISGPLPEIIDNPEDYLPRDIEADLVLDFLKHPDLSEALAKVCRAKGIPVVASGKKMRMEGVFTPPT